MQLVRLLLNNCSFGVKQHSLTHLMNAYSMKKVDALYVLDQYICYRLNRIELTAIIRSSKPRIYQHDDLFTPLYLVRHVHFI